MRSRWEKSEGKEGIDRVFRSRGELRGIMGMGWE